MRFLLCLFLSSCADFHWNNESKYTSSSSEVDSSLIEGLFTTEGFFFVIYGAHEDIIFTQNPTISITDDTEGGPVTCTYALEIYNQIIPQDPELEGIAGKTIYHANLSAIGDCNLIDVWSSQTAIITIPTETVSVNGVFNTEFTQTGLTPWQYENML